MLNTALAAPTRSWSSNVITQEVDGVKWRFKIDTTNKTAMLGTSDSTTGSDSALYWGTVSGSVYESGINDWVKTALQGAVTVPSSFTVDGEEYALEAIGNRALIRHGMSTLILPENIGWLRNCALYQCPYLTNLWFKGHSSPASGRGREYVNLEFTASTVLTSTTVLKYTLVGPNLKFSNSFTAPNASDATFLFPYREDNKTWASVNVGGTNPNVVYYSDLDETEGTITFAPTNATQLAEAFSTLPTLAPAIKTAFGLDARILVSTPIETATEIPSAFIAAEIPLDTTEWVAFTAKTQDQLYQVLAACSEGSRILIDPSDAEENLVVPEGYDVAVLMPSNGEIKPYTAGLMIIIN